MIAAIASILLANFFVWAYKAIRPPAPKLCGSPNGPAITSPRIKLRDGRHLAYKETGTPKEKANYKIINVHGFDNTKDFIFPASKELMDELGVYMLSYDRAGYGESDPDPKRSLKSEAMDVQELADQLQLGSKFYLIGGSMGGYVAWSCLHYISHRIAGVALVAPAVTYWWPSLPAYVAKMAFDKLQAHDKRTFMIAHHAPFLLYAWMTQKWFRTLSAVEGDPAILSEQDKKVARKKAAYHKSIGFHNNARQQGVFESLHRDLMVLFGNWEFDPLEMENPFPNNDASVHIWQGDEDRYVQVEIQRHVVERLPWAHYHEIAGGGHMFPAVDGWADKILKTLVLANEPAATM